MSLSIPGSRRTVSPLLFALGLCLILVACGGYDSTPDEVADTATTEPPQGEQDEIGLIAAHKALIAAMETGDVAGLTALMDPSPDLLVFHPFIENRFDGITEIDEGFGRMFGRIGGVTWTEAHPAITMEGNVGWITSHVLVKAAALPGPFVGRGTEIWVRGPGGWRLKHAHYSENAELAGPLSE